MGLRNKAGEGCQERCWPSSEKGTKITVGISGPKTEKHGGISLGKSPCWHLECIFVGANESGDSVETQWYRWVNLTCFASPKFSSLGIPSDANSASVIMKSFDLKLKSEFLSVIISIHHDELQIIDIPVTPPRLSISWCRIRNGCASNMLEGVFLDLNISDAVMQDCRHKLAVFLSDVVKERRLDQPEWLY